MPQYSLDRFELKVGKSRGEFPAILDFQNVGDGFDDVSHRADVALHCESPVTHLEPEMIAVPLCELSEQVGVAHWTIHSLLRASDGSPELDLTLVQTACERFASWVHRSRDQQTLEYSICRREGQP